MAGWDLVGKSPGVGVKGLVFSSLPSARWVTSSLLCSLSEPHFLHMTLKKMLSIFYSYREGGDHSFTHLCFHTFEHPWERSSTLEALMGHLL